MRKLYIIGSGGFGREVLWLAERINKYEKVWNIEGFIDDDESRQGMIINGYPVIGQCEFLKKMKEDVWTVIAIGAAEAKKNVCKKILGYRHVHFATLIDPSVNISEKVSIGEGSIICAGTIITVNVKIGKHVIINLDCTIGHDSILNDYVTVYPGSHISGNVVIGEEVELGTGMQIIQGKRIGKQSIIGAGAVVVKDIPQRCTAVGNPAGVIKVRRNNQ